MSLRRNITPHKLETSDVLPTIRCALNTKQTSGKSTPRLAAAAVASTAYTQPPTVVVFHTLHHISLNAPRVNSFLACSWVRDSSACLSITTVNASERNDPNDMTSNDQTKRERGRRRTTLTEPKRTHTVNKKYVPTYRTGRVRTYVRARTRTGMAANLGTHRNPGTEASMWVPREAAGLCRRFVRDFDGYR